MPESVAPDVPKLGLETRHVFLDTEVFKRRGHNLTVEPFLALGGHLKESNVTLHTTDITLRELERQIRQDSADLASEMSKLSKKVASWKHKAPQANLSGVQSLDASKLGESAWASFSYTVGVDWAALEHKALAIDPKIVFDKYFDRAPPFEDHSSKEFPDAFVVAALEAWCEKQNEKLYVITHDKAFIAAAQASDHLIPLESVESFLQKVTEAETPEAIAIVMALLTSEPGTTAVRETVEQQFDRLAIYYAGELYDGELTDSGFDDTVELTEFWIIAQSGNKASVLVKARTSITATVSYEDISGATYDKEDGIYFGAESAQMDFQDTATTRVMFTIDLDSKEIESRELLADDLFIQEPSEDF